VSSKILRWSKILRINLHPSAPKRDSENRKTDSLGLRKATTELSFCRKNLQSRELRRRKTVQLGLELAKKPRISQKTTTQIESCGDWPDYCF
jgi:hypothetical protein